MSGHTQVTIRHVSATFQLLRDFQVVTDCGQTGILVILSPGASHVGLRDETQVVRMDSR